MPPETAEIAPIPTSASPAADTSELIAKYAAQAAKGEVADVEVEAKPVAKPEKAAKSPKAEAKLDPKTIKLDDEDKVEPEPDSEPAALREKARYHLQHGDVAKAIDAAFGDLKEIDGSLADGVREALARKLGVGSQQWEKLRRHEQSTKRALAAKEQEMAQLVDAVKRDFGPFSAARQAYEAGDYEGAFKNAFGEDLADFQRKAISQRISKNPEVEQLKVQLERERAERQREMEEIRLDRERRAHQEQATQVQQVQTYVAELGSQLTASDDPQIAKYAQRPRFVERVFAIQQANFDPRTNTTIPAHLAAEQARDEVLGLLNEWEPGDRPVKADQASALPEQPTRQPRARNLRHAQAAEATSRQAPQTTDVLIKKYSKLISLASD